MSPAASRLPFPMQGKVLTPDVLSGDCTVQMEWGEFGRGMTPDRSRSRE